MDSGGKQLLGRLVPSFYGGVVFEECGGERWTIAGADLTWTDESCATGRSELSTDVSVANGWGNPVVGGNPPKPTLCGLCSESPDLVDLLKPIPKPQSCATCSEANALHRFDLDPRALEIFNQNLADSGLPPSWNEYRMLRLQRDELDWNILHKGKWKEWSDSPTVLSDPRFSLPSELIVPNVETDLFLEAPQAAPNMR